jgi:transposase
VPALRAAVGYKRIIRGLLKCPRHNKVFNADLVCAFNIVSKKNP